jgi:hypothetical protein
LSFFLSALAAEYSGTTQNFSGDANR